MRAEIKKSTAAANTDLEHKCIRLLRLGLDAWSISHATADSQPKDIYIWMMTELTTFAKSHK